uniref:Ubiquitin carboxyl-terminal hydrolase n=1 Tax=Tetraselmis sp. GSL018 TaxID=582737 RepID=A0A061RBY0_9CHLO
MEMEVLLDVIRAHMGSVRTPGHHDKVYKEECMYSFDTPESPGGLYISLSTFQAFSDEFVELDHRRTGNCLYLNEQNIKLPLSPEEAEANSTAPTKMNIGGEGGFQLDKKTYKVETRHALVVMPDRARVELPCPELPEVVLQSISAVIAHDAAGKQEETAVWEEDRPVSKYAKDLEQLPTGGKVIPSDPAQWKCDETGVTENLWLNLSTGFIGSGRRNWDGSGGNGAALRHYEATGKKYPLAVKLGTITPHGADVFSYAPDEDEMVVDPHLAEHLAHWGINMMACEKTEKTMAELEIERNQTLEFDKITEAGSELLPLSGPGLVGLTNLGNSCYMNSVMQVMWSLPGLRERYLSRGTELFADAPSDPASDLPAQLAKVGLALVEGKVAKRQPDPPLPGGEEPKPEDGLSATPRRLKALVGKGHPEFSSGRQQDACEYFQHLLSLLERSEHAVGPRLGSCPLVPSTPALYQFAMEDRIQCKESGFVSYKKNTCNVLGLNIPLHAATNLEEMEAYKERELKRQKLTEAGADAYIGEQSEAFAGEPEEPVIPIVPFEACLEGIRAEQDLSDYHSAVLQRKGPASHTAGLATMPPILVVQMRRYYVDKDWTPKKMNVLVEVPETLDLEPLRSKGPQPHENLQPEQEAASSGGGGAAEAEAPKEADPQIVAQLISMGFSENGSKRAAIATGNASAEASMEWVFSHMEDPDFNDPLPSGGAPTDCDPEAVSMLMSMGFTEEQVRAALKAVSGSVERAGDWLFSHMDDLDNAVAQVNGDGNTPSGAPPAPGLSQLDDGIGKYSLVGIVSHMGSNTACGHYICHVKKDGRWVQFNDEKVALSKRPPLDLGYLYFFKRDDV